MKKLLYNTAGIDDDVFAYGEEVAAQLKDRFDAIDETAELNQIKVLNAFR